MFAAPMSDQLAAARRADYLSAARVARRGRRVRDTVPRTPGDRRWTVKPVAAAAQL
jgi:hypothetical protein